MGKNISYIILGIISIIAVMALVLMVSEFNNAAIVMPFPENQFPFASEEYNPMYPQQQTMASLHCTIVKANLDLIDVDCEQQGYEACLALNPILQTAMSSGYGCYQGCYRDVRNQCKKARGTKGMQWIPPEYERGVRYR